MFFCLFLSTQKEVFKIVLLTEYSMVGIRKIIHFLFLIYFLLFTNFLFFVFVLSTLVYQLICSAPPGSSSSGPTYRYFLGDEIFAGMLQNSVGRVRRQLWPSDRHHTRVPGGPWICRVHSSHLYCCCFGICSFVLCTDFPLGSWNTCLHSVRPSDRKDRI